MEEKTSPESPLNDQEQTFEQFSASKPVHKAPPLFTINGFGVNLYGRRNADPQNGTYVSNYCLCALFIPILSLCAYRVADAADGGRYFISREPLSVFAKLWNVILLGTALALFGAASWNKHLKSPEYLMAQKLAKARETAENGPANVAFRQFAEVTDSRTPAAEEARQELEKVFGESFFKLPANQADEILRLSVERARAGKSEPSKKTVFDAGCRLAERRLADAPKISLATMDSVAPFANDRQAHAARRAEMVRQAAENHPDDPDLVSELALILEENEDSAGCEKLLAPLADKLGDREGARILGGIYSTAGEYDKAHALLMPYCSLRLKRFHAAAKETGSARERVVQNALNQLNKGAAGPAWYRTYEKKNKNEQQSMVDEYLSQAVQKDAHIKRLEEKLVEMGKIVPVALDLGMVMLQRAQNLEPEERHKELLAAEQVFLALQNVADQSDAYRVYYGQALYWLGRAEEGGKLFAEYLDSKNRSTDALYTVARVLREVGAHSESWAMGEEAYAAEKEEPKKQGLAGFMVASALDLDDKVLWLERCNQADKSVQASLAESKGDLAEREGKDREAEEHFRRSTKIYAELPKNAGSLNNAALAYGSLFRLSGNPEDLRQAATMMEDALRLAPENSILAGNAALLLNCRAILDLLEGRMDFKTLSVGVDDDLLGYLYDDVAGREEIVSRYIGSAYFKRSLELYKRTALLAPRNRDAVAKLLDSLAWTCDEAALADLQTRLTNADLDLALYRKQSLDAYAGKNDENSRKVLTQAISRYAEAAGRPAANKEDLTPIVAQTLKLSAEFNAFNLWRHPVVADEAVVAAEKTVASRPCLSTRWNLISALFFRANARLAAAHPEYAAALEKSQKSLGGDIVLILTAEADPKFRAAATADSDVKRIVALEKEVNDRILSKPGIWNWAFRRQFAPESAEEAGRRILADRTACLLIELEQKVRPLSARANVHLYWLLQLRGDEARAREVLRAAAKEGVPLPVR